MTDKELFYKLAPFKSFQVGLQRRWATRAYRYSRSEKRLIPIFGEAKDTLTEAMEDLYQKIQDPDLVDFNKEMKRCFDKGGKRVRKTAWAGII